LLCFDLSHHNWFNGILVMFRQAQHEKDGLMQDSSSQNLKKYI
jgi:hypothetical protein